MLLALQSQYAGGGAPVFLPEVYWRSADIARMFRLFGQPVTVGGITVTGLLDRMSPLHFADLPTHVIGADTIIEVERFALPALAIGAELVAGGQTYFVRHYAQVGDGATVRVLCAKN